MLVGPDRTRCMAELIRAKATGATHRNLQTDALEVSDNIQKTYVLKKDVISEKKKAPARNAPQRRPSWW